MNEDITTMQKIVDLALGKPKYTFKMNRNAPQPDKAFAAVRLYKQVNPGYDKREYIEDELGYFFRTTGLRILHFDILFSHDDDDINVFEASFYRPDIHELAKCRGMTLLRKSLLDNRDKAFETDWAVRTGIRVEATTIYQQDTPIQFFDAVSIEGKFNEGNKVYPIGPISIGDDNESSTF